MNTLLEKGIISEMSYDSNFAYILEDNTTFLSTEYKVLQSQLENNFVKCMKMHFNGKIQLLYLTGNLKPLSAMLKNLDGDSFLSIVRDLISDVLDVKHNGFLSCRNIDISFDRIYVDPSTYLVSLIYLPISYKMHDDVTSFESELRTKLIQLISSTPQIRDAKTTEFTNELASGKRTLEDLLKWLKPGANVVAPKPSEPKPEKPAASKSKVRLVAVNAPVRVELDINKDRFIIGKDPSKVDGVVGFNKMISRVHCRIDKQGSKYTITDMHSANGTYLNRVKLAPDKPQYLNNGDIIRMANSDFQISIG